MFEAIFDILGELKDCPDEFASLNPFSERLKRAEAEAKELRSSLESIKEEILPNDSVERSALDGSQDSFDLESRKKHADHLEAQLSSLQKEIERISEEKQRVDALLSPILEQIRDAKSKRSEAIFNRDRARELCESISNQSNSYERAMLHKQCEAEFGVGSPGKVVASNESEIRRIDRDLEKLTMRAQQIGIKAAREIKKVILDGNNLCYQSGDFIGLSALKAAVPALAEDYDVVVVFDSSIRRAIRLGDADIRSEFGEAAQVHIVASKVKADETILDIADQDSTAFIVSNDRFSDFFEKSAVQDRRLIRHEIVSGRVLIHDLGISERYVNGEQVNPRTY